MKKKKMKLGNLFVALGLAGILSLVMVSCEPNEGPFIHEIRSVENIEQSQIIYQSNDSIIASGGLKESELTVNLALGLTQIGIQEPSGKLTIFAEIPEEFINMDADVEIGRNRMYDYFPDDWANLKKANFTSLHIVSKTDRSKFFTLVVYTGTAIEIGRNSEQYNQ